MDKKLILICITTGIGTTILSGGLFFCGIFLLMFLGALLIPGLLFGLVLSLYYKDISTRQKLAFIIICSITYLISALTTFYLSGATNDMAIVLISTFSLPLTALFFDRFIKKLKSKRNSLAIGIAGGFLVDLIMHVLLHFVNNNVQGESGAVILTLTHLLIFPLWHTVFALTTRLDVNV
ncbi:MAG: hypothetical protein V4580_17335 [Bacteroidota bacterium]